MRSMLFFITSILFVNSCAPNKRLKVELADIEENQPINQSESGETNENFSNLGETDEKANAQSVTIIIGDYLDRSLGAINTASLDVFYINALYSTEGENLFNLLDESYGNQEISPYYQYATNQFPNNRIIQSSKASATVADAEELVELAMGSIEENEVVDQIIIGLGTLDFCQSTAEFSSILYKMIVSFLKYDHFKSATFNFVSPLDLTLLPSYSPVTHKGISRLTQHQFCPALRHQEASSFFGETMRAYLYNIIKLAEVRTVFYSDITQIPSTLSKRNLAEGFNLSSSGIAKIATAIEDGMIDAKKVSLNFLESLE